MQNLIEVLERVHIQLDDICRLVVNADSAVLNVLASVTTVVRLCLPHCSLAGLRWLAYALKALLAAASQAREHLVLVCGHQPVLRLPVTLVAVGSCRGTYQARRRVPTRRCHSVYGLVPFCGIALVVHSFPSVPANVSLHLVGHFTKHSDHLFRSNLVGLQLGWLNNRRCYGNLLLVDAGWLIVDRGAAADLAA